MYPFWDLAIEPLLTAAGARRVVEIGALRGETTVRLLAALGDEAELHVIDPAPAFDPTEHERAFDGRYVFHRDISHAVLPTLEPVDAALVDGDHNWFTVYHELVMLRDTARAAGRPLPLLILHDVGWPYGRRDLYYVPERIPADQRQPYERRGIRPGEPGLLDAGGMNVELANAVTEGGPRNGVMTALEDFLAEHDEPTRLVVLPVYYGLAVVAEERRLAETPALAERLDWLEGPDGQAALAVLAEDVRLEATVLQQEVLDQMEGRVRSFARRYLDLLRVQLDALQDTTVLDQLERQLGTVRDENVGGDLMTAGAVGDVIPTYLRGYLEAFDLPFQRVFVAAAAPRHDEGAVLAPPRAALTAAGLADGRVRFLRGPLDLALKDAGVERLALACIAVNGTADLESLLRAGDARVVQGGFLVLTGVSDEAREQVDRWLVGRQATNRWVAGAAMGWRKIGSSDGADARSVGRAPVPLLPPLWIGRLPVSVVTAATDLGKATRASVRSVVSGEQIGTIDRPHEVVVGLAADADPDGSLPRNGPWVRVVRGPVGGSLCAVTNEAVRTARGDVVVLLDVGGRATRGVLQAGLEGLGGRADRIVAVLDDTHGRTAAVLVPRALLEQHGCLDERVSTPAGSLEPALSELVDRLVAPSIVRLIVVDGEHVRAATAMGTALGSGDAANAQE